MDWLSLAFWTKSPDDVQKLVLCVGAIFASFLAFWRVRAANKAARASEVQANVATQAHIAELLSDAAKGLEDEKYGVQLAAIMTLGRLGRAYIEERRITLQSLNDYLSKKHCRKQPILQKIIKNKPRPKEDESLRVIVNAMSGSSPLKKGKIYFKNIDFTGANFSGMEMRGFIFYGCILDNCNFSECEIYNTEFIRSSIINADFTQTKLYSVKFDKSPISYSNFHRVHMTAVNFRLLYAYKTVFSWSFLKGVSLMKINLEEADFQKCDVNDGISFNECNFSKVDFSGANIFQSNGLKKEHLKEIIYDTNTVFPWAINLKLKNRPIGKKIFHALGG